MRHGERGIHGIVWFINTIIDLVQKTAAMDLLLRLPSLKFFACRRRTGDADSMYLSMTLKSFSINFYNPNQVLIKFAKYAT